MALFNNEIDITRNIKIIEWLKSELLTDVANLFRLLVNGMKEEAHDILADTLSNIILIAYLLGRRLGLSYNAVEIKLQGRIKLGLIESHEVEKNYGDLKELSKHLSYYRNKNEDDRE